MANEYSSSSGGRFDVQLGGLLYDCWVDIDSHTAGARHLHVHAGATFCRDRHTYLRLVREPSKSFPFLTFFLCSLGVRHWLGNLHWLVVRGWPMRCGGLDWVTQRHSGVSDGRTGAL